MTKQPRTNDEGSASEAEFEEVVAALLKVDPTGIAGKHKAKAIDEAEDDEAS